MIFKKKVQQRLMKLQDDICQSISTLDGKVDFGEDHWQREEGGGGRSRAMEDGSIFEKGGVNFSAVHGTPPPNMLEALALPQADFFATGVSIVIHPRSPMVPIIHMNVRYFEMSNGISWFGGGIDLTPHYIDKADAKYFHSQLKNTCDKHHPTYYPKFKDWADEYFYIKHRKESRGIGGIFFDRLQENSDFSIEDRFAFIVDVGKTFIPVYTHLVEKNKNISYGVEEIAWQKFRRGRYVEFNLLWDKGTKFGLYTNGRTESILMSMPPSAIWAYDFSPKRNSKEAETLELLQQKNDFLMDNP